MALKLRIVKKLLATSFDLTNVHALSVSHLVLSKRALVRKLLPAIVFRARIDPLILPSFSVASKLTLVSL
jgi:hypothetical protein